MAADYPSMTPMWRAMPMLSRKAGVRLILGVTVLGVVGGRAPILLANSRDGGRPNLDAMVPGR
jgi:hypothetical protein